MKRLYLPFFLFLFMILEGVAIDVLPTTLATGHTFIVPHWVLVFLVLISMFYDRENTYFSVIYGILFGLLVDVAYTGILGVYMFSYGIGIYVVRALRNVFHANFYVALMQGTLAILIADVMINIIFHIIGMADIALENYMIYRLLPTVLANLVFLMVLYPVMAKRLLKWGSQHSIDGSGLAGR